MNCSIMYYFNNKSGKSCFGKLEHIVSLSDLLGLKFDQDTFLSLKVES